MASITSKFIYLIIRSTCIKLPGKADNLLKQIYSPGFRGISFTHETVADLITKEQKEPMRWKRLHGTGSHEILI